MFYQCSGTFSTHVPEPHYTGNRLSNMKICWHYTSAFDIFITFPSKVIADKKYHLFAFYVAAAYFYFLAWMYMYDDKQANSIFMVF